MQEDRRTIVVLGCGGIGFHLVDALARGFPADGTMWLIDGDTIETKNLERQFFHDVVGMNKAAALAKLMVARYPDVNIETWPKFLNDSTVGEARAMWLVGGAEIFVCVDNDATRVFVQEAVKEFNTTLMIVGGNGDVTGQAQLYARQEGTEITPKITEIAPEILYSKDRMPDDEHCLESAVSEPQTACVNRAVALAMEMMWRQAADGQTKYNEIRVDIRKGQMTPFWRNSLTAKTAKKRRRIREKGDSGKGTGQRPEGLPGVREDARGGEDNDGGGHQEGVCPEAEHRLGDDLPGGRGAVDGGEGSHRGREADGEVSRQVQGELIPLAALNDASEEAS